MESEEDSLPSRCDGLAADESADAGHAARALRNKLARDRRKRRKQARERWHSALERATSGPGAACDFSSLGLQSSRLGQAQETYLKQKLDRLASFAVEEHGYTRNSAVVLSILQDILNVVPGRPTAYRLNAQGLMKVMPPPSAAWKGSYVPKVLGPFASGTERETIIRVSGTDTAARPVPLGALAEMGLSVHAEQYLRRLNECRELLPQACQEGEAAEEAKLAISQKYLDACFYGALMLVSQPLRMGQTFLGHIFGSKQTQHNTITFQEAVFVWDALGIDGATHARMWQVYQDTTAKQQAVVNDLMAVRVRLLGSLAEHDAGSGGMYADLVDATSELLSLSQQLLALRVRKQCKVLYQMKPYQAAVIAAMQLPRTSLHNMISSDRLPINGPLELLAILGDPAALPPASSRSQRP